MHQTQISSECTPDGPNFDVCGQTSGFRGIILVVEDEPRVREAACEILEYEGYRVLRARSAGEAKTLFEQYHAIISLLLTDVILPDQNGCDLAAELRKTSAAVRTILISGYPLKLAGSGSLAQEEMFYLAKPFCADSLLEKVREVLGGDRQLSLCQARMR